MTGGVSGGGSPAAGGASRTEDTPQGKRPSSPSGPPTKKQRTDIEKSRDHTIVSSEEEGRGQGFRASGTASGSSKLSRGSREKESQEAINKRKIDKTATVKIKPKPDKRPEPLAKARGSVARELEKREERPSRPKERDQPEGLYPVLDRPPRGYGHWSGSGRDDRPRALILFSGRARPGDLHQSLVRLGWTVCSVDTLSPKPTNLLDDAIYCEIQKDLIYQFYDALWVATPCGTFSPLREKQPGPRVLRTVQRIKGLPKEELTVAEQKQLKEANLLVRRSADAIQSQRTGNGPWGMENPDHPKDKPSIWLMPEIEDIALRDDVDLTGFDQCRFGLETTKPTIFMSQGVDFSEVKEKRCDHPKVEQVDSKGKTYLAAHPSTVQKWIETDRGRERASRSQGEYTMELSRAIARAFHETQKNKPWLEEDLKEEPL